MYPHPTERSLYSDHDAPSDAKRTAEHPYNTFREVRTDDLPRRPLPVRTHQPQPVPPPAPTPAVQTTTAFLSVSYDYSAELALARQLMQSDEENFQDGKCAPADIDQLLHDFRNVPGAKFATKPSRGASRGNHRIQQRRHDHDRSSRATSSSLSPRHSAGASLSPHPNAASGRPLPAVGDLTLGDSSRPEPAKSEEFPRAPSPLFDEPAPAVVEPARSVIEPQPGPSSAGPSVPPSKRPARSSKRSPAPRRQECTTCGKKFQRPCQLTTHIRSHTGEQPHACPVCSRRFSVLSNCQRHIKLCQKRSTKILSPSDEELMPDSAPIASSSFIAYPSETGAASAIDNVRRPNEVLIRPKVTSSASGSGLGGDDGESAPAGRKPRSSSAGSLRTGLRPSASAPAVMEGVTVPIVPSSTGYSSFVGGYASGSRYGYDEAGSTYEQARATYEPPQTIYEEPSAESGYGQPGFERRDSRYGQSECASSSGPYGRAGSGYDASGSGFNAGYGQNVEYAQSPAEYGHSYAGTSHPSPSHVQSLPSPSHVQSLPSPSHVHQSPHVGSTATLAHPTSYGSMMSAPSPHMVPSMTREPASGYYSPASRSIPALASVPLRRSTIISPLTIGQREALGLSLDQRETMPRRQMTALSDSGAGPPIPPSGFAIQSSSDNPPFEPEIKHEDGSEASAWAQGQGSFQAGYQGTHWAGPTGFHGYQQGAASASAEPLAGSSTGYSYAPQPQSYAPGPGVFEPFPDQSGGGYVNETAYEHMSYAMPNEIAAGTVAKQSHHEFPEYPWPGTEQQWNSQSEFNS